MPARKQVHLEAELFLNNLNDDGCQEIESCTLTEYYQALFDTHLDLELPQKLQAGSAGKEEFLSQYRQISEFQMSAYIATDELCCHNRSLEPFCLPPDQLDVLLELPNLGKRIKNKLTKQKPLTVVQVTNLLQTLADSLLTCEIPKQTPLLQTTKSVMDVLKAGIMDRVQQAEEKMSQPPMEPNPDLLYQFKITLQGIDPPIWRRIQVQDCTLDKLHEHIQTAMGWENSHLHQFEIEEERYGAPDLLEESFSGFLCFDSTTTLLSQILPKTKKRFAIKYEYDFGDEWIHEVLFEGLQPLKKNQKYPLCLEGEHACPPEEIGGIWGYLNFLSEEEQESDDELLDENGPFDPAKFDPKQATRDMRKGLPDWRDM